MNAPTQEDSGGRFDKRVNWYIWAALSFVVIRLWLQPLSSSFWLDETGTALLMQGTFQECIDNSLEWVGQPIMYMALLWPVAQLPGPREIVLRLPSVLGMALATYFVYRIGMTIVDRRSGALASLIFAAIGSYYAADARPYALGLAASSGALLFLIRWAASGRWLDMLLYSIFAALTVYLHFLFSVVFLAHAAYLLMRRVRPAQIVVCTFAVLALIAPLSTLLMRVATNRSSLSSMPRPGLISVITDSTPVYYYDFLFLGLAAAIILMPLLLRIKVVSMTPEVRLVALCWLVPVVGLYAASFITPVFVPRYLSVSFPGLALLTAWVLSGIQPSLAGFLPVLFLIGGAALDAGGVQKSVKHNNEDWRGAMSAISGIAKGEPIPILVRSGFIESATPEILANPKMAVFLAAPQMAYPVPRASVTVLPIRITPQATDRLDVLLSDIGDRFVLVSCHENTQYRTWLEGRLGGTFTRTSLGNFGSVPVDLFQRVK